ncbi:MAG TPA: hypothetical protein VEL76_23940 [Gemmataceae bacterium]|nr:hypothetical protein [Gemmataceae bacterium]
MRTRLLACLPLLALFALPAPAPAQGKADKPTLVVRIRSLDTLFDDGKLLLGMAGQEKLLSQLEELIKSKLGPKGLAPIDKARPLGLYAHVGKDLTDLRAVLLVPVADEKGFLDMLDTLNFKAEKDKDDLYTVKQNIFPIDIYLRFANKYAYVTALNSSAVAKDALLDPAKVFPASQKTALSVSLRLDQVPDMAKQILLQHLEDELSKVIETRDKGTSEAQHAFKGQLIREIGRQLTAAVRDGTDLQIDVDLDRKANALTAEVTLGAKTGSPLAATIEKLGQSKSSFGGLLRDDAALNLLVHYALPEKLRTALGAVVDDAAKKALGEISDETKRKQLVQLIEALAPTFKEGEIDLAISMRGPGVGGRYTLVAGLRLKDAEKINQTFRDLIPTLPPTERPNIKLDIEKVGNATIHSLDISKGFDAKTRAAFGDEPVHIAFRPDAVLLAVGTGSLKAIKEAIAAEATTTAPLRFEMSVGRLAAVLAHTEEQKAAAAKLLALGDEGRVRVAVEGGQQLRVRFHMGLSVVRLLGQFAEPAGKEAPKKEEK